MTMIMLMLFPWASVAKMLYVELPIAPQPRGVASTQGRSVGWLRGPRRHRPPSGARGAAACMRPVPMVLDVAAELLPTSLAALLAPLRANWPRRRGVRRPGVRRGGAHSRASTELVGRGATARDVFRVLDHGHGGLQGRPGVRRRRSQEGFGRHDQRSQGRLRQEPKPLCDITYMSYIETTAIMIIMISNDQCRWRWWRWWWW